MFTGIVTDMGEVLELEQQGDLRARIGTSYDTSRIDIGASIACEGVCLTVIALGHSDGGTSPRNWFDVQISAETVSKTNLTHWKVGKRLNLERALKVGDELGGHIVSGHVDGVGHISRFEPVGESWELCVLTPPPLGKYFAYKGSITINGVSLTVNRVTDTAQGCECSINLIPHTIEHTALGSLKAGSRVNLEIDLIARYVERMLTAGAVTSTTI